MKRNRGMYRTDRKQHRDTRFAVTLILAKYATTSRSHLPPPLLSSIPLLCSPRSLPRGYGRNPSRARTAPTCTPDLEEHLRLVMIIIRM